MAEWSKAVDLSPTISGCAGSNPASCIFFGEGGGCGCGCGCGWGCGCGCGCGCVCVLFDAFIAQR